MKKVFLTTALTAFILVVPTTTSAAVDYFLKIDGIEGESTESQVAPSQTKVKVMPATEDTGTADDIAAPCTGFVCDDGECVESPDDCLAILKPTPVPGVLPELPGFEEECDEGFVECPDGTCVRDREECPEEAEAEPVSANTGVEPDEIDLAADDEAEVTSGFMKIDDIEGEVLENESEGIEPDEIDTAFKNEQATSFSVLLDSGGDDEESQTARDEVATIILQQMQEDEVPVEEVAFYYNKIKMTTSQSGKLFGLIEISVPATVEVDAENSVKVKFPWWGFLVGGKDSSSVGKQAVDALSDAFTKSHDPAMAIIRKMNE